MGMRQNMDKWLDNQNPAVKEWVEVCKRLTPDDAVRGLCMKLASDYEEKKIDDMEFLASLANTTGKSLEEIDAILAKAQTGKEYQYCTFVDETFDAELWARVHSVELKDAKKFPFYITIPNGSNSKYAYVPNDSNDTAWQSILKVLAEQTKRRQ